MCVRYSGEQLASYIYDLFVAILLEQPQDDFAEFVGKLVEVLLMPSFSTIDWDGLAETLNADGWYNEDK